MPQPPADLTAALRQELLAYDSETNLELESYLSIDGRNLDTLAERLAAVVERHIAIIDSDAAMTATLSERDEAVALLREFDAWFRCQRTWAPVEKARAFLARMEGRDEE
jgi:hypothetical protein